LRAALEAAFDHAVSIREMSRTRPVDGDASDRSPRWIAIPAY
jgi:hypothetical protein